MVNIILTTIRNERKMKRGIMENGVDPKEVQKRLGHNNIATTLQVYTHTIDKIADRSVAIFEEAVNN